MENQHRHIKGYRELTLLEVEKMNDVKTLAAQAGDLILSLRVQYLQMPTQTTTAQAEREEALRWITAAEMQMQQAFMAVTRSIARPTNF